MLIVCFRQCRCFSFLFALGRLDAALLFCCPLLPVINLPFNICLDFLYSILHFSPGVHNFSSCFLVFGQLPPFHLVTFFFFFFFFLQITNPWALKKGNIEQWYQIPGSCTYICLNVSGTHPLPGSLVPFKSTFMSLFEIKWINKLTFFPVLLVQGICLSLLGNTREDVSVSLSSSK